MQINLPSVLAAFVGSPINRGGVIKKNPFSITWERIFYAYEKYHLHCFTSPPYNDVGYLPEKHAAPSSVRRPLL